jgi:hypothetical protein
MKECWPDVCAVNDIPIGPDGQHENIIQMRDVFMVHNTLNQDILDL